MNFLGHWVTGDGDVLEAHSNGLLAVWSNNYLPFCFGYWQQVGEKIELKIRNEHARIVEFLDDDLGIWHLKGSRAKTCGSITKIFYEQVPEMYGVKFNSSYCKFISQKLDRKNVFTMCNDEVWGFYKMHKPKTPFTLITLDSDLHIDERSLHILNDPLLDKWYSIHVNIVHPKLQPIPVGIPPHLFQQKLTFKGYDTLINRAAAAEKTQVFHCAFAVGNNPVERTKCEIRTGLTNKIGMNMADNITEVGKSMFCVSPNGAGVDCFRTWESLFCRTVPIITRNKMMEAGMYDGLPVAVIEDWDHFNAADYTRERYDEMMRGFDPSVITIDRWIK